MSIPLHTTAEEAPRGWYLLKAQAVVHAVLALLIGGGSLVARQQFRDRPEAVTFMVVALSIAWIAGLVALRRRTARLRTEIPLPSPRRRSLLLAAFPMLQLAGIVPSILLHDPEAGYVILGATSIALFVVVMLSGVCFALADVPIRWEGWMITLGTSVLAVIVLV